MEWKGRKRSTNRRSEGMGGKKVVGGGIGGIIKN